MTAILAADALVSSLAGIGFVILRRALATAELTPWLCSTLRFGALVLAVFYLLRPVTWIWNETFIDRWLLATAALAPVAVLLIAEAVLRRHAPGPLKWLSLIGTLVFVLGAFLTPRSLGPVYLGGLLAFQIASLFASAALLWRGAAALEAPDRKVVRTFAVLVALLLPLLAVESAVLSDEASLHLSALVLLFGVWLLFGRSVWITDPKRMLRWSGALVALAMATGWALSQGRADIDALTLSAPLLAALLVGSLVATDLGRASGGLEERLLGLLGLSREAPLRERLMEALAEHKIAAVPGHLLSEADAPAVARRLAERPVWTAARGGAGEDADQVLADIASLAGATHLIALGLEPPELVGLALGPSETNDRLLPLLTALARRVEGEAIHET